MPDTKTSSDPVATLVGTEIIACIQGGVNKRTTPDDIVALVPGGGGSSGTLGLVQLSDGAGGFDSDAGLSYGSGVLSVDTVTGLTALILHSEGTDQASLSLPADGSVTLRGAGLVSIQQDSGTILNFGADGAIDLNNGRGGALSIIAPTDPLVAGWVGINGGLFSYTNNQVDLGDSANFRWRSGFFATSVVVDDGDGGGIITAGASVETVALNATGNVDAASFSIASDPFVPTPSSGTLGLVQLSDGAGGFSSDAGLSFDTSTQTLHFTSDQILLDGINGLITLNGSGTWDGISFKNSTVEGVDGGDLAINSNKDAACHISLGDSGQWSITNSLIGITGNNDGSGTIQYGSSFFVDLNADGTIQFENPIIVSTVKSNPVALAALGDATTQAGTRAFINDGLTLGVWGATAVAGGSVTKPVWSDGTNWLNG